MFYEVESVNIFDEIKHYEKTFISKENAIKYIIDKRKEKEMQIYYIKIKTRSE